MRRNLYEELVTATAEDGASAAAGTLSSRRANEVDALLDAWMHERHENIETRMFLERAQTLLGRILADRGLTSETDHEARQWMRALKAVHQDDRDN